MVMHGGTCRAVPLSGPIAGRCHGRARGGGSDGMLGTARRGAPAAPRMSSCCIRACRHCSCCCEDWECASEQESKGIVLVKSWLPRLARVAPKVGFKGNSWRAQQQRSGMGTVVAIFSNPKPRSQVSARWNSPTISGSLVARWPIPVPAQLACGMWRQHCKKGKCEGPVTG
eukprot:3935476-Rhodomonas_salina.1